MFGGSKKHELVAISGPGKGLRAPLRETQPVVLGRTSSGFHISDPMVSIYHARVWFQEGAYWVRDLESASGTFHNGVSVGIRPERIGPGSTIQLGDTILEVVYRRRVTSAEIFAVLAPVLFALVFIAFSLARRGADSDVVSLVWPEPILRGVGLPVSSSIDLPAEFLRKHGLGEGDVRMRRVTDFDMNGRSELWLRIGEEEHVVTFDGLGGWREAGIVPTGCMDVKDSASGAVAGWPSLRCSGVLYDLVDDSYRPVLQEGAVVWMRPHFVDEATADLKRALGGVVRTAELRRVEKPKAKSKAPKRPDHEKLPSELAAERLAKRATSQPFRFDVGSIERLAGFLADRGIEEGVHYIICEGAFPGIAPQALTESGDVVPLLRGCQQDVSLSTRGLGRPAVIAFTAEGHRAVKADIRTFYGGNPDGIFLAREHQPDVKWLEQDPGFLVSTLQVRFEGADRFFSPIPQEDQLMEGRFLISNGDLAASPMAVTATLMTSGRARLEPEGCAELEVLVGDWHCALSDGCLTGSTFFRVRDVGCGEPRVVMEVPYGAGVHQVRFGDLQLRSDVETKKSGDRLTVTSAKFTYRAAE
jgi:hypothetical protein